MRLLLGTLLAWAFLWDSIRAESSISSLREAAVTREKDLQCLTWDCECAFNRQRGCCCGGPDLKELEDHILHRVIDLSKSISRLGDQVIDVIGGMKVAFTSHLSPTINCLGPFTRSTPIHFNVVTLNHGSGFNPSLGLFTAPRSGLYSFSYSIYSKVERQDDRMYYKVQLMNDGEAVASTWEDNREDPEDSSSQTVLLSLERGSQVYVQLLRGRQLCGNVGGLNSFSGLLLHPTLSRP